MNSYLSDERIHPGGPEVLNKHPFFEITQIFNLKLIPVGAPLDTVLFLDKNRATLRMLDNFDMKSAVDIL